MEEPKIDPKILHIIKDQIQAELEGHLAYKAMDISEAQLRYIINTTCGKLVKLGLL